MIMPKTYSKIHVVTVTYGDRWNYLRGLLVLLEGENYVRKVTIIDNASNYDVAKACNDEAFYKAQVFKNSRNYGSAGGFSQGIEKNQKDADSLILLLDDDNYPQSGTLSGLIDTYNKLLETYVNNKIVVLSFRECQHYPVKVKSHLMEKSDFIGFNPFDLFQRNKNKYIPETGPEFAINKRGAAYGGMMFSSQLVDDIGLPKSEFILYFDDVEYTKRMLSSGYIVWLDKEHPIDDVQENFSTDAFKIPILGFVTASSDKKIYYLLRNGIYLDFHVEKKKNIIFRLNKLIFLSLITIICLLMLKKTRMKAIHEAYRDARNGSLGFNERYPI